MDISLLTSLWGGDLYALVHDVHVDGLCCQILEAILHLLL